MRVDAKIQARQWILNAIQNHSCIPNKEAEREIRKFIGRLQRDLKQLNRVRDLQLSMSLNELNERAQREVRKHDKALKDRRRAAHKNNADLVRLVREQRADSKDRRIRFEHAVSK